MFSIQKQIELRKSQPYLSQRLQELRKEFNLTRIMLLDACGVSYNTLYRLFQGHNLTFKSLTKIAEGIQKIEKGDCFL